MVKFVVFYNCSTFCLLLFLLLIANGFVKSLTSYHSDYNNITTSFKKNINDFHQFSSTSHHHHQYKQPIRESRKIFNNKNNFISFDTRDDNIEVGFEFSVPFLSVPVKRSINTVKNTATSVMQGPLANINSGAVLLASVMVAAGVIAAYLWRAFYNNIPGAAFITYGPPFLSDRKRKDNNNIWNIVEKLEKSLQKYDIDATACTQRTVCSYVRSASENVARGTGSSSDKILDGVSSASWITNMISGTAIDDAVRVARQTEDCSRKYSGCKLKSESIDLDYMLDTFLSSLHKNK